MPKLKKCYGPWFFSGLYYFGFFLVFLGWKLGGFPTQKKQKPKNQKKTKKPRPKLKKPKKNKKKQNKPKKTK